MMKPRKLGWKAMVWPVLVAIPLSALSLVHKTQYCICGPGWGFPFPMYHVACGTKSGDEFVLDAFFALLNVGSWIVAAMPIVPVAAFVISRKEKMRNGAEPSSAGNVAIRAAQEK